MPPPADPHLRAALTRTIPCDGHTRDHLARTPAQPGEAADVPPPAFAEEGLAPRLARVGLPRAGGERRFDLAGVLGAGATGRVYALVDRDLDRPVAVKVLARGAAEDVLSFIDEARITASLSHPNVLPVHGLEVDDDGRVFFTMKQIDGRSLADAIADSTPARRAPPLDDPNAVVSAFIGVCQALAYAHHRRIVHQDVKPANIMLGGFGEVLLVDWGSACRLDPSARARIYGTPLYMSPEQARGTAVDARSDVYCVGATLFHALFLRPPTWDDDADRFFALKRAGDLTPPDARERAGVPAALVDIALQALRPRPEERYSDAEAMLADLRAWQSGQSVRAHREGLGERLARWHRRHAAALWSTVVAVALVVALAAAWYGERLQRIATWGGPVVAETFADESWRGRWRAIRGGFERREGRLVSTGIDEDLVVLDRRLRGWVAIDYVAEIPVGVAAGDLSVVWARDVVRDADGAIVDLVEPYSLQFGACDGCYSAITRGQQPVSSSYRRPEVGRRYAIHAEIVDDRLSIAVDGRPLCEWIDQAPFTGGYLGLVTYGTGKTFADVRVCVRGVAERVAATAVGDALAAAGRFDEAAEAYAAVVESHPDAAIGDEARYRLGRCRWRQGRRDDAEAAWSGLVDRSRRDRARLDRIDAAAAAGDDDRVLAELDDIARDAAPAIRMRAGDQWTALADGVIRRSDEATAARYLALRDRRFADLTALDIGTGRLLNFLGRPAEALERCGRLPYIGIEALALLGRLDEAAGRYPGLTYWLDIARFEAGLGDGIPASDAIMRASALAHAGRAEEAIALAPPGDQVRVFALAQLGRLDEALALARAKSPATAIAVLALRGEAEAGLAATPADASERPFALLAVGDAEAALALARPGSSEHGSACCAVAIAAWRRGDADEARRLVDLPLRLWRHDGPLAFQVGCVQAFARAVRSGDWRRFDAELRPLLGERYGTKQQLWHDARYLLGEIDDEAFVAQPCSAYASSLLLVRRAMRHERRGEPAAALADYRAWLELPRWRRWYGPDVALQRLVDWRVAELAR